MVVMVPGTMALGSLTVMEPPGSNSTAISECPLRSESWCPQSFPPLPEPRCPVHRDRQ